MSEVSILDRLKAHRIVGGIPENELAWLIQHGQERSYQIGDAIISGRDLRVDELMIVFGGCFSIYIDRGAGPRRTMEWKAGDVSGLLPYSRLTKSPGAARVEEPAQIFAVHRDHFPEMLRECPVLVEKLVQVMLDRARNFAKHDEQDEKLLSLGRLSAGLAHELDNPASAVIRGSKMLGALLEEADQASRAIGESAILPDQLATVRELRDNCLARRAQQVRSPLEQARHEEAISDWLDERGLGGESIHSLVDSPITLSMLDDLERRVSPEMLAPALRWVASGCALRTVATEVAESAARITELVRAVKGFTHMDEAGPRPVDVEQGLTQTLAVLRSKAKGKSVRVKIEAQPGLPHVNGNGGELNQVWSNLIDNALDAVGQGGSVDVSATQEGNSVVVRVIDDGPGISTENQERIFEPFFTTKPVGKGTGLGLDIVKRLVSRQSGSVDVFSTPGRTEFRVTLPVGGGHA